MKVILAISLSLFLISFSNYTSPKAKMEIKYTDGNNNHFHLLKNKLTYSPVKKENSSSGTYEGKTKSDTTIKPTSQEISYIQTIAQLLIDDKRNIIEKRLMGCGTLTVISKQDTNTYFISSKSIMKREFEGYLNNLF